ncbi:MAG: hypothetical protein KDC52_04940 [Ignavibacteriae bacterium]|nr:hypothetical protein [Ignavibacteriota bacterium]
MFCRIISTDKYRFVIKIFSILAISLFVSCSSNIEKSQYQFDETVLLLDTTFIAKKIFTKESKDESLPQKAQSVAKISIDDCNKLEKEIWQFHHYEPAETKSLGIWPTHNRYNNYALIKELKDKWGFNLIFIQASWAIDQFDKFLKAGFNNDNIIIDLNVGFPNYVPDWDKKYKDVYAFYVDEPFAAQPNYTIEQFEKTYNKIKSLNKPLFITGDFKPSNCLDEFVQFTDKIMFTSYHRTYQLFGCTFRHWPENIDQRDSWDVMKERYGDKFTSTWIAAHQDTLEYFQLFKKAVELNLESVWFYQLEDTTDQYSNLNLAKFCEAAWQNGYLKKVNQKVKYQFECKNKDNPCNCDETKPNEWKLIEKKSLGEFREEKF